MNSYSPTQTAHRIQTGIRSGAVAALLIVMMELAACGGGGTGSAAVSPGAGSFPTATPAQPTITTIAHVDAGIVATPYLAGSTIRYLSDCQTSNTIQPATGCVQGSDTLYDGTSPTINGASGPWRTTTKGAAWLSSQTSGIYTLALEQGGVWNAAPQTFSIDLSGNTYCPAGQTCSEIREYPAGGTGPKPVIYGNPTTTANTEVFFLGSGQRIMNLSLIGSSNGSSTSAQIGVYLYRNVALYPNSGYVHDDSVLNVDLRGFDIAIEDADADDQNNTVQGNHIYDSTNQGYLGGSQNLNLNYNYFENNGSDTANAENHSIYVASHSFITGINIIGNYVTGYYSGTGATQCTGGPLILHGSMTDLVVSGNTVIEASNASGECWGISANNLTAAPYGGFYRNALFSDNIVVNGGSAGMDIANCPNCVIENNLIISDNPWAHAGISVPPEAARTSIAGCTPSATVQCYDDPSTNYTIRNNTIYFTTNANEGMTGIQAGDSASTETQVGFKVYNNTVTYLAASSGLNQVYCFDYPLPASAYTIIDNNNCYVPHSSTLSYAWEQATRDSLSNWAAATGFDTIHSSTVNPGFALSAYPYFPAWSDNALAYQLFNNGTTNIFASPLGSPLAGGGRSGPSLDITGAPRSSTAPAIGAYE